MRKESQSLLDFINTFPLQAFVLRQPVLNDNELQALRKIFDGKRSPSGAISLPADVDSMAVASLAAKEIIKNRPSHIAAHNITREVEITQKGQEILRQLILGSEKSMFDHKSNITVASRTNKNTQLNWFERLQWKLF